MKRKFVVAMLSALVIALFAPAAWAQMGSVRGTVKDSEGKPMANIQVQIVGTENGRKYNLKTNKNGEFFSLGVALGTYDIKAMKDGQLVYSINRFPVKLGENTIEINLEKEAQMASNPGQAPGMSAEDKAKLEQALEAQKKQQEEALKIKGLNEKLAQAQAAEQAGNLDQAVSIMQEATQTDPTRDVLWSKLAEYERLDGMKATDPAQRNAMMAKSVEHYQKAIETAGTTAKPDQLAAYYNNMGQAYGREGKTEEAAAAYQKAAELDPAQAGKYYFNLGALMTNTGKIDEAIAAFDKTIAIDPNNAEAYYWKGVNMVGKATLKDGKMTAPEGTAEAFNKYLELQPTGQYAEPAKQMLASIGASVQTQFGTEKAKSTPAQQQSRRKK